MTAFLMEMWCGGIAGGKAASDPSTPPNITNTPVILNKVKNLIINRLLVKN
jgi:hypothetical protein